jgi:pilus assembly protein FimV
LGIAVKLVAPVATNKEKALAAAQKFLDRGQPDRALAEFARVVQEEPGDTRTWLKMAEIYARRGQTEQARDIYLRTGALYVEQGALQKAIAVYKNALKLAPGHTDGHLQLAAIFRRVGQPGDAAQQLGLAAAAFQKAGRPADALPPLRQIVELGPERIAARIQLAEMASQAGAMHEAIRELTQAAEFLKARGRADEYVRVLERLVFHEPHNFDRARELAAVYIARGKPRQALSKLQAAAKVAPRDPENIQLVALALEQIDPAKASSIWKELAELHDQAGRGGARDGALRAALALEPADAEALALAQRWGVRSGPTAAPDSASLPTTVMSRAPTAPMPTPPPVPRAPPPAPRAPAAAPPPPPPRAPPPRSAATAPPPLPPSARAPHGAARGGSSVTPPPGLDVSRVFSEAEVFVKYGLYERAVEHLRRVVAKMPDHRDSREKLAAVLAQVGRPVEGAAELATLADQLLPTDAPSAAALVARALALDPASPRALAVAARLSPPGPSRAAASSGQALLAGELGGASTPPPDEPPEDLLAELEQVDFFIEQDLRDEARSSLHDLARRFRGHPLVAAKMKQLEVTSVEALPPESGAVPRDEASAAERDGGPDPAIPVAVMPAGEKPDLSTHGDLGIAYKEMGLFDAAIAEFKLLEADPARKVFALTMIGECLEAQGAWPDAVVRYKEALNAGAVADAESTQLYYLLGGAFERMGDRQEALYFFEKVAKRSGAFRDVARRIEALKAVAPSERRP